GYGPEDKTPARQHRYDGDNIAIVQTFNCRDFRSYDKTARALLPESSDKYNNREKYKLKVCTGVLSSVFLFCC
ncbi:MAG: hypothetical protein ACP5FL_08280, partial [Thermoplasmatota archaeon]